MRPTVLLPAWSCAEPGSSRVDKTSPTPRRSVTREARATGSLRSSFDGISTRGLSGWGRTTDGGTKGLLPVCASRVLCWWTPRRIRGAGAAVYHGRVDENADKQRQRDLDWLYGRPEEEPPDPDKTMAMPPVADEEPHPQIQRPDRTRIMEPAHPHQGAQGYGHRPPAAPQLRPPMHLSLIHI